jgi:hypothetical protein
MLKTCTAFYAGCTNGKLFVHISAFHKYTVLLKSYNYNTNEILKLYKIYKM